MNDSLTSDHALSPRQASTRPVPRPPRLSGGSRSPKIQPCVDDPLDLDAILEQFEGDASIAIMLQTLLERLELQSADNVHQENPELRRELGKLLGRFARPQLPIDASVETGEGHEDTKPSRASLEAESLDLPESADDQAQRSQGPTSPHPSVEKASSECSTLESRDNLQQSSQNDNRLRGTASESQVVFKIMQNPPKWVPAIVCVSAANQLYPPFGSLGFRKSELNPRLLLDCGNSKSPTIRLRFTGRGAKNGEIDWSLDDRLEGHWLIRDFDIQRIHRRRNVPLDPVNTIVEEEFQALGWATVPLFCMRLATRGFKNRAAHHPSILQNQDPNIGRVMKLMFKTKTFYDLEIWFLSPFVGAETNCLNIFQTLFEQRENPFEYATDDIGDSYYDSISTDLAKEPQPRTKDTQQLPSADYDAEWPPLPNPQIAEASNSESAWDDGRWTKEGVYQPVYRAERLKSAASTQVQNYIPPTSVPDSWEDEA